MVAAALSAPTKEFEEAFDTDLPTFCRLAADYYTQIARYIELGDFPSPPKDIFENVRFDAGCLVE